MPMVFASCSTRWKAVEEVHVHLHLAEVLVRELAELEIHQHEAAEQAVIEDKVDIEVIAVQRDPLLPRDKAEALAHFKEERLEPIDDGLLEIALVRGGLLLQIEELEDKGILEHVAGDRDLLAGMREREDLVLVTVLGEPLEEQGADLARELADGPGLAGGLDLVEGAGVLVLHAEQGEVVRPAEERREERPVRLGKFARRGGARGPAAGFDQHC